MSVEPFRPFGLLHLASDAVVVAIIALVVGYARRLPLSRARDFGRKLGVALVVYYAIECLVRYFWIGTPAVILLPLEICSMLFFVGCYGHLFDSAFAHEFVYFWTFAATFHALLTPTPHDGFPTVEYFRYFACHGLLILNAAYVLFVLDVPLRLQSLVRCFVAMQLYTFAVGFVDWALGENFLYLREKPPSPTLFDAMGPWPYYIGSAELVAFMSCVLWLGVAVLVRRAWPRETQGKENYIRR